MYYSKLCNLVIVVKIRFLSCRCLRCCCWRSLMRSVSFSSSSEVVSSSSDVSVRGTGTWNLSAGSVIKYFSDSESFVILCKAFFVSSPRLSSKAYRKVCGAVVGFCNEFGGTKLLGTGYQGCSVGSAFVDIGGRSPPHLKLKFIIKFCFYCYSVRDFGCSWS